MYQLPSVILLAAALTLQGLGPTELRRSRRVKGSTTLALRGEQRFPFC
jgi:hypothetical protein